jgi:hypothetical protein
MDGTKSEQAVFGLKYGGCKRYVLNIVVFCLIFLASENFEISTSISYRISLSIADSIIISIGDAVRDKLSSEIRQTAEQYWMEKAEEFCSLWQFTNCIGSIDGKHFEIQGTA